MMSTEPLAFRARLVLRVAVPAVLVAACLFPPDSGAQQIVRMDDSAAPLERQVAAATGEAVRQAALDGGSAMVGYGIVVRAPANELWGMYSLRESAHPTLLELLDGRPDDTPVTDGDRSDRIVDRRAAVLVRLDPDGRPVDVRLVTLESIAYFRVDTIYWLGDASREESFELLAGFTDPSFGLDIRRGALYSIARHGFPERALPILMHHVRDASEPDDLRKAAIHSLGMLRSRAARQALLDLIYDETS